jgi:hypothetical protein
MLEIGPLKDMLKPGNDIIFVDNSRVFRDAVRKLGYDAVFTDRFAGQFGHCTEAGNRLLAKNIADAIAGELRRTGRQTASNITTTDRCSKTIEQ